MCIYTKKPIAPQRGAKYLVNIIKKTEALAFYGPNMETGFNFNIPGILWYKKKQVLNTLNKRFIYLCIFIHIVIVR